MRKLTMIGFLFLFLVFLVWANVFMSRRFAWYFSLRSSGWLYLLFGLLTLFIFFGVIPLGNNTTGWGNVVYRMASLVMGTLLYLLLAVVVTELLRLFLPLKPLQYGFIALLLAMLTVTYGIWHAAHVRTVRFTVPVRNLHQTVRVMHLSDLHLGHFRGDKFLQRMLERSIADSADVIFITGDLFDGKMQVKDEVFDRFRDLPVPVYFVEGNHEQYTGAEIIKQKLREAGVRVLENETVDFGEIQITGLRYLYGRKRFSGNPGDPAGNILAEVLPQQHIDKKRPAVLLQHSPKGCEYIREQGYDLCLAGHTHGGQLFPFTVIASLVHTYNKEMYDLDGMTIYVSQGAGTFGPPMRVGSRSEIALITLVPAKNR